MSTETRTRPITAHPAAWRRLQVRTWRPRWRGIISAAVIAALLLWALVGPSLLPRPADPAAVVILAGMIVLTALAMRWLTAHFVLAGISTGRLPNPLYGLLLAVVVLVGYHAAVPLAIVAPLLAAAPDLIRRRRRLGDVLREAAIMGMAVELAAVVYAGSALLLARVMSPLHAELLAAVLASGAMLVGSAAAALLELAPRPAEVRGAARGYLGSPGWRFQVLMLVVGPLLPLAGALDSTEAELAWVLFLAPLFAIYYLALLSLRLELRSTELQRTIEQLSAARQREAELTGYAALITRAQEEERRRLARELHDDTAQALIALSRGLDALSTQSGSVSRRRGADRDAPFVESLGELAKRTLESIRRACQDLRPSVLDDLGLPAALESLASAITQRGMRCDFSQQGAWRACPPEVEVTVYRIAQEALSNALRHAGAGAATLALGYDAEGLWVEIRDDGSGFNYAAMLRGAGALEDDPEPHAGLGLLGMRERAALIGAALDVGSGAGAGTRVTVRVPLPEPAPGQVPGQVADQAARAGHGPGADATPGASAAW